VSRDPLAEYGIENTQNCVYRKIPVGILILSSSSRLSMAQRDLQETLDNSPMTPTQIVERRS
jgi:hypothetical protein